MQSDSQAHTHQVTEPPRILMKAGAYSDSLTAANGDPLKDLKETLYGSAVMLRFSSEQFWTPFLKIWTAKTIVDPFAIPKKRSFQLIGLWFFGGGSWTYMDAFADLIPFMRASRNPIAKQFFTQLNQTVDWRNSAPVDR